MCVGCAFLDAVSQQIEHCGTQALGMLRVTGSCFSIPRTDLKVELDSSLSGTLAGLLELLGRVSSLMFWRSQVPFLLCRASSIPGCQVGQEQGAGKCSQPRAVLFCSAVQGRKGTGIKGW